MAAPERTRLEEFDALYRGHVGDVYRYSLSVVRDPEEAADVTQTTFLNAYRAYREPLGKPQAWLLTIARNVCFERYRRSLRRPRLVPLNEAALTPADDEPHVQAEEILHALHGIPPRQRTALMLEAADGRSRAEIAKELGIGETTVTGLLMRARGNLRLQLDEGMSCELARRLRPQLEGTELPDAQRRAAIAHLRNCERCSEEQTTSRRSISGLLAALIPAMRSAFQPVVGLIPGGAAGIGATAAVVAAAGTIAWQAAPSGKSGGAEPTTPAVMTPFVAPAPATEKPAVAALQRRGPAPLIGPLGSAADSPAPAAAPNARGTAQKAAPPADGEKRPGAVAGSAGVGGGGATQHGTPAAAEPSATGSTDSTTHQAPPEPAVEMTAGDAATSSLAGDEPANPGNGGTPPGQAKADTIPPGLARAGGTPPGQARVETTTPGQRRAGNVPPGQAKKDTTPPGQAKDDDVPPGLAKKDGTPPGQAKNTADDDTTPAATRSNGNANPTPGEGSQGNANAGQGSSSQGAASESGPAQVNNGQGAAAAQANGNGNGDATGQSQSASAEANATPSNAAQRSGQSSGQANGQTNAGQSSSGQAQGQSSSAHGNADGNSGQAGDHGGVGQVGSAE